MLTLSQFVVSLTQRAKPGSGSGAQRSSRGKLMSLTGGGFTLVGVLAFLAGLSDLQNLALLAVLGIIFIPLGMLLLASGRLLASMAVIEEHVRQSAAAGTGGPQQGASSGESP